MNKTTIEIHPFRLFAPSKARYLILGSFIAKRNKNDFLYDWFYSTKRNQFWPIIEEVYNLKLKTKKSKQALFTKLGIAITDIIYKCERKNNNNLDSNLINITYNTSVITKLLKKNQIEKIYFTSRFVEKEFKKRFTNLIEEFPKIVLIILPSPSPRYATKSIANKVKIYRKLLPKRESKLKI